ncbi:hypothetical protein DF156_21535 [Burkholderia ubonensis]|uniref:Uncharacterized protein n=1 Tax=Burkholderia ubonensis TaxID=101571 RepID=A0AB74DH74_9BURK|nr:hypothetical protein CJO71_12260 [Burkholderia ubonensis]PAK00901.1 hypothetical protein CJO68_11415 [Burkholderia ubonensis]RQP33079.1 hypothetical protein DF155_17495 [Burkholderia ubonensis]RQP36620.1 hypothetical protein DF154_20495 [Burkholderia ubonensis]RQP36942.1 hypothetical protein DF156_21535 [Burkholderia ubonensis]
MTGRLNGVGDARSRRCAADDLFSRICSEPPGQRGIKAPAGSRARNRVSKSARRADRSPVEGRLLASSIAEIRRAAHPSGSACGTAAPVRTRRLLLAAGTSCEEAQTVFLFMIACLYQVKNKSLQRINKC